MRSEDRYSLWAQRLQREEDRMSDKVEQWERHLRFYRNEPRDEELPTGDTVWVNYIFGMTRVILPQVYFKNPEVVVLPRRGANPMFAKLAENLLNYQIEEIGLEMEMRKAIFDAMMTGVGVIKLGYAPAVSPRNSSSAPLDPDDAIFESSLSQIYEGGMPLETSDRDQDVFEPNQRITANSPFAVRIPPRFVLIDPLATSAEDARWIAHIILRTVDQVRENKNYPSTLTSGIQGTRTIDGELPSRRASSRQRPSVGYDRNEDDTSLVAVYEIWDRETRKRMVMDEYNMDQGVKEFLQEDDWPYEGVDGFPFEFIVFNQDPDSPWGVSDVGVWENPIQAINLINSMHYNHVKRFNRKYLVKKGTLSELPGSEEKLTSPHDGEIVEINGDPKSDIVPLIDAALSQDGYNLRDVLRNELTFMSGVTEQRKGGSEKAHTATEASIIEQQARVRDSDRVLLVSKFSERVIRKLFQLDRMFLDSTYDGFLYSPEAMEIWTKSSSEILKSEVDVKIRMGSSAYISKEVRNKQLVDLLNIGGKLADPMGPVLNVRALLHRIGESMEIDRVEELILPPSPVPVPPPPGGAPTPGGGGASPLRNGNPSLGSQLSSVQNLGVRRTPNPTSAGPGEIR